MNNSSYFHTTIARTNNNKTVSFSASKFVNDYQQSLRDSTSSSIQEPETMPETIKRSITYCVCDTTRSIQKPQTRDKSKLFSLLKRQMDDDDDTESINQDSSQRHPMRNWDWGMSCMPETFLITSLFLMSIGIGTLIGINLCAPCIFDNQRRIVY